MQAIIHKKIKCNLEDQLTGDVFGAFRYLPYKFGWKFLLDLIAESLIAFEQNTSLQFDFSKQPDYEIHFWPKFHYGKEKHIEPDLLAVFENGEKKLYVIIEVKYHSGLSDMQQKEQLEKFLINKEEYGMQSERAEIILLHIGPQRLGHERIKDIIECCKDVPKIVNNNTFYNSISWSQIHSLIINEYQELKDHSDNYDKSIMYIYKDLLQYLEIKELASFISFTSNLPDCSVSLEGFYDFRKKVA